MRSLSAERPIARSVLAAAFCLIGAVEGCSSTTEPQELCTPVPSPSASPTATTAPTVKPTLIPTATPSSSPAPSPTPAPTPAPAPPAVAVWEGTITLNTYGWEQALVPTDPDDPAFPYPRMEFARVASPTPREYRVVFLQNEFVQLILLPELGGRILRWTDLTTGRQLLYANPVIKPTHWGYRGWWLATGGIEWAFPVEEHGLNEYRGWEYQLLWNGIRMWDTDERTGLTVQVTVQLEAQSNRIAITPHISNPTDQPQPYQFWANAMVALSDLNTPSPYLTFILPASEVIIHSTADGSLPGSGSAMTWPEYAGRDFGQYSEWRSFLGVFAPQAANAGYAGAYDLETDQGIVRVAPTWVRGVKFFCLGDLDAALWTDDGSRYFELWGGLLPTFWDYTTLEPGASVSWTEHWYAVSGMGGYSFANGEGAIRLTSVGTEIEIAVQTARPVQATIVLRLNEAEVDQWQAATGPGQPFLIRTPAGSSGEWGLSVLEARGDPLIQFGP